MTVAKEQLTIRERPDDGLERLLTGGNRPQRGWCGLATHTGRTQRYIVFLVPPLIATEKSRKKIPPGSARAGAEDDPVRTDNTVTNNGTELTTERTTSTATNGPPTGKTLQNCICGWSKITTARGLKIHQGIKKCLSELNKGSRIDQYLLRTRSSQSSEARRQENPHSPQGGACDTD